MPDPRSPGRRPSKTGRRFVFAWLAVAGLVTVVLWAATAPRRPAAPPEPARMDRLSARRLSEYVAGTGPAGAARAAEAYLAGHKPAAAAEPAVGVSRPGGPLAVHAKSRSPHPTAAAAEADAAAEAAAALQRRLADLPAPVHATITPADVRAKYLKPGSVTQTSPTPAARRDLVAAGLEPDQVYAELDAVITDDQLRPLRAAGRVGSAGRGLAMLVACLTAAVGYFKLDALTRGHLSGVLAVLAVAVAAGAVAGLAVVG